jgi:hypothetical protein
MSRHRCGRICMHRKKDQHLDVLAGQRSASRKSTRAFGSSASCTTDLGFIDPGARKTLQPLDNPFGPRLSPMS